ncbi:DUF4242 domain-containing protein [Pseudonocardia sp. H11422]|uniref:DUF4242 domain-containing protein n=1 Tax=Pseudonocardia sp. H11422 TaxID=2835866 RepID=UPI001BDC3B1A|nr:DUF4242 domain-containing protein [Pseudonocardia sp. H11422]
MPKFVIERDLPGAGDLPDGDICAISRTSNSVLAEMPDVQWVHSYVTGDKIFCLYIAPDEDAVRRHAEQGGFPANAVREVVRTIDPTTGGR